MKSRSDLADHVTFCPQSTRILDRGAEAEWKTASYLDSNLSEWSVGKYRILVNYNMPVGTTVREIDVVVINKFGIFLLEVKSWLGKVEAYDDQWVVQQTIKRDNPLEAVNAKARIFHSQMFGPQGRLQGFRAVSVAALVVLTEGLQHVTNRSSAHPSAIVGLDQSLLDAVRSTDLLIRRTHSQMLSNEEIEHIYHFIYGRHESGRAELIGNYRILRKLRYGDLFEEYEAENVNVETQHVRVKRYKLQRLTAPQQLLTQTVRHFKRDVEVVSALGSHPHIVMTMNFFPDEKRPDIYYEITELVDGKRLDEIIKDTHRALTLDEQLNYLQPVCQALAHAHNHRQRGQKRPVYHRNVCPETVMVSRSGIVKLADFDFAKYPGSPTLILAGAPLIEKLYTPPELLAESPPGGRSEGKETTAASDIYSLGMLWYVLASLPRHTLPENCTYEDLLANIEHLPLLQNARTLMQTMLACDTRARPQRIEEIAQAFKELREQK